VSVLLLGFDIIKNHVNSVNSYLPGVVESYGTSPQSDDKLRAEPVFTCTMKC
jgi:hypothetical protein